MGLSSKFFVRLTGCLSLVLSEDLYCNCLYFSKTLTQNIRVLMKEKKTTRLMRHLFPLSNCKKNSLTFFEKFYFHEKISHFVIFPSVVSFIYFVNIILRVGVGAGGLGERGKCAKREEYHPVLHFQVVGL